MSFRGEISMTEWCFNFSVTYMASLHVYFETAISRIGFYYGNDAEFHDDEG